MSEKPRDILEFLRRTGQEPEQDSATGVPPAESPAAPRRRAAEPAPNRISPGSPTVGRRGLPVLGIPEVVVLHRRQLVIAGIAAGLLLILAFLLGMVSGGGGSDEADVGQPVGVWTIKLIEYERETWQMLMKKLTGEGKPSDTSITTAQQTAISSLSQSA